MKQHGFTLIECLVYLAVFSVFVTSLVVILSGERHRLAINQHRLHEQAEVVFLFQKIEWLLNTADSIRVVAPDKLDIEEGMNTLRLEASGGRFYILSMDRPPEVISAMMLNISSVEIVEEVLSTRRKITLSYRIGDVITEHVVYVSL